MISIDSISIYTFFVRFKINNFASISEKFHFSDNPNVFRCIYCCHLVLLNVFKCLIVKIYGAILRLKVHLNTFAKSQQK